MPNFSLLLIPKNRVADWRCDPRTHIKEIVKHARTQAEGEQLAAVGGMHTSTSASNVMEQIENQTRNPTLNRDGIPIECSIGHALVTSMRMRSLITGKNLLRLATSTTSPSTWRQPGMT